MTECFGATMPILEMLMKQNSQKPEMMIMKSTLPFAAKILCRMALDMILDQIMMIMMTATRTPITQLKVSCTGLQGDMLPEF